MGATTIDHGPVVEEVKGLIRVYKDGHVERSSLVPSVGPSIALELGVTCSDVCIDKFTNVWARVYAPITNSLSKLPLLVYFHGGGFCVGSASWSCYHEFLARLSSRSLCLIISVNYRLAPENPLPAAYEDGVKTLLWLNKHVNLKRRSDRGSFNVWTKLCDMDRIFLGGDSAGANIAHQVAARLAAAGRDGLKPLNIQGLILIQPFLGGETRTESEGRVVNKQSSVLNLAVSDSYWRMALPRGGNRDHTFCRPPMKELRERMLVCVAEMDILMDREMEMYNNAMVKRVVYRGVGHAFHILGKSQLAQTRTHEMLSHIDAFIHHSSPG